MDLIVSNPVKHLTEKKFLLKPNPKLILIPLLFKRYTWKRQYLCVVLTFLQFSRRKLERLSRESFPKHIINMQCQEK